MVNIPASQRSHPFPMVGVLLLATILGFLVGRTVGIQRAWSPLPTTVVEDLRPKEAVVILDGVRDGRMVGSVQGDVRLWIGDEEIIPNAEGNIAADAWTFLVNAVSVPVPEGMQFVASERGSKYYPVLSAGGQGIVPKNRVYFKTAEAAEAAGYRR